MTWHPSFGLKQVFGEVRRVWLFWKILAVPQKVKALSWDPANPPQTYSTWKHLPTKKKLYTDINSIQHNKERDKQSKYPSTDKCQMWRSHTMAVQSQDKVLVLRSHEQWKQGVEDAGHTKAIQWVTSLMRTVQSRQTVDNWLGVPGLGEGNESDCWWG